MNKILAVILAGGHGERLSILSLVRAKPAIPFAGKYRIIDFTLSNCANSGIRNVFVLPQYEPISLAEHIGIGAPWGLIPPDREIHLLQPYLAREPGHNWYKGTADAVYQNLDRIMTEHVERVLILSGDHVYKMEYQPMIQFHEEKQADVTIAVTTMAESELMRFGTVTVDDNGQVTDFQEKVKKPRSNLVSMGIYLFQKDVLYQWLEDDARSMISLHDFGKNILPKMLSKSRVFAYRFEGYWRDVGTVQTYWQTNMDTLEISSVFLAEPGWPIRTKEDHHPPAKVTETARVSDSLICSGCVIEGSVEHSVLSPGVRVAKGAVVRDSVIMTNGVVGRDCIIDYSILDKEVVVEAGCHIGFGDDFTVNRKEPNVVTTGITLVGKRGRIGPGTKVGRNCVIYNGDIKDFGNIIESGSTVKTKRWRPVR